MDQTTPILESFTESVGDGPSQPLLRKLMSMLHQPEIPGGTAHDADLSGFSLVIPRSGETSRQGGITGNAEDILQQVEHPLGDVESIEQSGFRFSGCDSPRPENYFADHSRVPADLVDKVPIDLLHAINDALVSTARRERQEGTSARWHGSHSPSRRQRECSPGGVFCLPGLAPAAQGGQDTISHRLERLENICSRTESYVRMVFDTLEKRLQLLEAQQQTAASCRGPVQEQEPKHARDFGSSCPMSPIFHPPCSVSTFVSPDMLLPMKLMLNNEEGLTSTTSDACLSPIDVIPSPTIIMSTPVERTSRLSRPELQFSSRVPESEAVRTSMAPHTPEQSDGAPQRVETSSKPEISGVAVFSLAGDPSSNRRQESRSDVVMSEPVVAWDNEGFPYLRPTQQVAMAPPLRDTIVMTWDGVGYLSRDTSDDDDDVATCLSSDDDAFSYNFNSFEQPRHCGEAAPRESLELPANPPCTSGQAVESSASRQHEEVVSVVERLFSSLLNLSTTSEASASEDSNKHVEVGLECAQAQASKTVSVDDGADYAELAQDENLQPEEEADAKREFEVITLDTRAAGIVPRVTLAFNNSPDHQPASNEKQMSSSSDMRVKIDLPCLQDAVASDGPPVTVHVGIAPLEVMQPQQRHEHGSQAVPSIVQDISVSVEGPYQDRPHCDIVPDMSPDTRQTVTVSKDKLHLTDELVADYTLKLVPREPAESSAAAAASDADLDPQKEVSSVIHELCFSVDVPVATSESVEEKPSSLPDLPLQIAISLSGNPLESLAEGGSSMPRKDIAAVVLNLEALQKSSGPSSVASRGESSDAALSRSESQSSLQAYTVERGASKGEEAPCVLRVEDRRLVTQEDVPGIKQELRISVEVSRSPGEAAGEEAGRGRKSPEPSAVQVGISLKTLPSSSGVEHESITCVEIPEEAEFERVPYQDMEAVAERKLVPAKEELVPLAVGENMFQDSCLPVDDHMVEPFAAPPPSPVESTPPAALPENHPFKDVSPKERRCNGFEEIDGSSESVFLVKDNVQPVIAKVPRPVIGGMTQADLIRGSLHYDGKACLLSVCTEDFWTAEDMCQAPTCAAAAFPKSSFERFCLRGCVKDLIKKPEHKAFGFVEQQAGACKDDEKGRSKWLGFLCSHDVPGQAAIEDVCSRPRTTDFAFPQQQEQQLTLSAPPALQQQQQQPQGLSLDVAADNVFADWDSSLSLVSRSPAKRLPSPPPALNQEEAGRQEQQQQQVQHHQQEQQQHGEQQDKPRVPDSPGARSCIIDGDVPAAQETSEAKPRIPDSPGAQSCMMRGESEAGAGEQEQVLKLRAGRPPLYPGSAAAAAAAAETSAQQLLELLDAGGSSEEEGQQRVSGDLHLLPLDPADSVSVLQEETFFDALQCSGLDSKLGHSCAVCRPRPLVLLGS